MGLKRSPSGETFRFFRFFCWQPLPRASPTKTVRVVFICASQPAIDRQLWVSDRRLAEAVTTLTDTIAND